METIGKDQVSRGCIRGWLENYQALIAQDKAVDDIPRNSGYKPKDGIPNSIVNQIVLADGLKAMRWEARRMYRCCKARWIDRDEVQFTLECMGLTMYRYYWYCDRAVDYLYYKINGAVNERKKLLMKVLDV